MTKLSTLYIRRMPEDVKKKFKLWAMRNNISLTQALIQAMKDAMKPKESNTQ